ncbi:ankyrin repeat domain-containing protein [Methylobacterium tardum]|uniref:ankyrin repeat domain-containing protein n=1 Tax=Methylobacterium tardum TaxID=374432 RepID=UPI00361F9311
MSLVWDGITKSGTLPEASAAIRHRLADAAERYDWTETLSLLADHADLVNTTRPDGSALFAPLHHAAHGHAPREVCAALIEAGAWRMLKNARWERPIDIAERCGHSDIVEILRPVLRRTVPLGVLTAMQHHFHAIIRGRVSDLVRKNALRLPELGPLLELSPEAEPIWFAVPGMYGGFSYQLRLDVPTPVLISESWCRVVGGSGQRHEITATGSRLIGEGFV